MTFQTPAAYLRAFERDPTLAILPIQTAAEFWGVSRAAMDGMLRTGKIDEIRIGKARFVRTSSLVALQRDYDDRVAKVRAFLEHCAREQQIVTYEPVMALIGLSPSIPADRTAIGEILGDILQDTWAEHRILLTVIVHRKTSGRTRPGPGFAAVLEDIEDYPEYEDEDEMVERETQKVWDFYAPRQK